MKVVFHQHARLELSESIAFYDSINPDLGDAYFSALVRKLEIIGRHPDAGRTGAGGFRVIGITRFPFSIRYRVDEDLIYVIAVSHQRRQPDYWCHRLRDIPD